MRTCDNELRLTCTDPAVVSNYRRCLGLDGPLKGDAIEDLRSSIRKELGFGKAILTDRSTAFIGVIPSMAEARETPTENQP